MKTKFTQQEILLVTGTKFSQREWAEKNAEEKNKFSPTEQLEEACWNGALNELLPEIMEKNSKGKNLSLWQIRHCKSFLEIELSESSPFIEKYFSIDPYFFVPAINLC
ncbi:MAG: hypothetical protein ACR2FN_13455 [Chitinophagaceae bacterium]